MPHTCYERGHIVAVESTDQHPNGLKVAWDTIVAPKEAFESLRVAPTWGWPLLIVIVVGMLSVYAVMPASVHAMQAAWPAMVAKNPALAGMSQSQQQAQLAVAMRLASFGWIAVPIVALLSALVGSVLLLIFNAAGHGEGTFAKFWAAQWNIALVSTIGSIVLAAIVLLRGAESFATPQAVQSAVPNLGMLVPEGAVKLHAFLAFFTPFTLWATWLEVEALAIIGRTPRVTAWLGGCATLVLPALLVAGFAH